jgi:hypothetical protein
MRGVVKIFLTRLLCWSDDEDGWALQDGKGTMISISSSLCPLCSLDSDHGKAFLAVVVMFGYVLRTQKNEEAKEGVSKIQKFQAQKAFKF